MDEDDNIRSMIGDEQQSTLPHTSTSTPDAINSNNDDDELICRICRENGERESLVHPCKCSGSIRYVHEKCLLEWIEHSKTETCELCKHKFQFAKVYKSDAPQKLNMWELIVGLLQLGKGTVLKLFRLMIVLIVWSVLTPVLTAWIMRVFLSASIDEITDIPNRVFDEFALFQDCLVGAFLAISILVLTIFIAGIKEFINDILRNLNEHLRTQNVNDAVPLVAQEEDEPIEGEIGNILMNPQNDTGVVEHDNDDGDDDNDGIIVDDVMLNEPTPTTDQQRDDNVMMDNQQQQHQQQLDHNVNAVVQPPPPFPQLQPALNPLLLQPQQEAQQPIQIVFQDENEEDEAVDLEEFIGLKGSFISLIQNCLVIILMNALYLCCLVFVPFTIGRCALVLRAVIFQVTNGEFEGVDILTKLSITAAGYMFIISLGLCCFLLLLALQRLIFNNNNNNNRNNRSLSRTNISHRAFQLWVYTQTVLKVTFISSFNFVLTPSCCGLVLNLATAEFFGSTVQERLDTILNDRVSYIFIHWFLGLGFLFNLTSMLRLLRSILRRSVLWFFNDPDDPNFSFIREAVNITFLVAVRRITFTICMFSFLILALVRAPLKLAKSLKSDTFPLSLMFSHPFLQIGIDIVMYSILTQIGLENIRPQLRMKTFVEKWLRSVGTALDLNDYLFPRPVDVNNPLDAEEQNGANQQDEVIYKPPAFPLRIAALLMMAWSTATVLLAALILIPLLTGRGLILISPTIVAVYFYRTNDLYTHLFGSYVIGATILVISYVVQQVKQQQVMHVLSTIANYFLLGIKCLILGALWFTVIPVLLGLAFELSVVIPILMSNKTALMPLSELWAFGVFLSGICVRFTYLLKQVHALEPWRMEFDRVALNGAQRLEATRVFMNIIFPIIFYLSLFICLPYLFAKQIAPLFAPTRLVQHKIMIYSYPTIVLLFLCYFAILLLHACWNKLHESVRDRRYLVRRSVVNLETESDHGMSEDAQQVAAAEVH